MMHGNSNFRNIFKFLVIVTFFNILKSSAFANLPRRSTLPTADELLSTLSKSTQKKVLKNKIYVNTVAKSWKEKGKKTQEMTFVIAGIHERSCQRGLRRLTLYEEMYKHFYFVTKSLYNPSREIITLYLSAKVLPVNFILTFKLPRMKKEGDYPFAFHIGIFKGLRGTIHIRELSGNRCLYFTRTYWKGPHTGFPNLVLELFSETLSYKTMEKLFRLAKY